MRFAGDRLSDGIDRLDDLWDRLRITTFLIAMTGVAVAGVGALAGLNYWVALGAGLAAGALGLGALWLRARRQGTTLLGDD